VVSNAAKAARGKVGVVYQICIYGRLIYCPSPGLVNAYHPNYASNNTIDAEDPRPVGYNPLTRPTATHSPWEKE